MKKTKIICTIGPASENSAVLEKLFKAGMNIARLNFSHGSYQEHAQRVKNIRETSAKLNIHIGILADIQGPKIRTGYLSQEVLQLTEGQEINLTVDRTKERTEGYIYVDYPGLVNDVKVGGTILLVDGLIQLSVVEKQIDQIKCVVEIGGELMARKGVALPGASVNLPALTEKDRADLEFIVKQEVDFIAVSFARKAEHIREIRQLIEKLGGNQMIIAKIENEEGVRNCREIIEVADGIMVARGDLGVEVPPEDVPLLQQQLIEVCNTVGKPVITATEMLESMIRNPRPTRAEITDVAHAILSGTDAIMLSAETAVGKYPVEAVEMMSRTAKRIEDTLKYEEILARKSVGASRSVADAISHATCQTSLDLHAKAVIISTHMGVTARMVSKYRPNAPIIAATFTELYARQLTISWGVYPILVPKFQNLDEMFTLSVQASKEKGFVMQNDLVVITAGFKVGETGSTNLLKVDLVE